MANLSLTTSLNIILVNLFLLPLGRCGAANVDNNHHHSASCIQIQMRMFFTKTINESQRICNFFHKNTLAEDGILIVSDAWNISSYIDELMSVINNHCYIKLMNFNSKGVLKVGRDRQMESFGALIIDRSLYKQLRVNSKFRNLVLSFPRRAFVVEVEGNLAKKSTGSKRFDVDFRGMMDDELSICKATASECFGVPIPAKSSLTIAARKFEPFTVADNRLTFNRGTEILLLELIAQKLNIQLNYEDENSSSNGR